jgi:hypothetical protein
VPPGTSLSSQCCAGGKLFVRSVGFTLTRYAPKISLETNYRFPSYQFRVGLVELFLIGDVNASVISEEEVETSQENLSTTCRSELRDVSTSLNSSSDGDFSASMGLFSKMVSPLSYVRASVVKERFSKVCFYFSFHNISTLLC